MGSPGLIVSVTSCVAALREDMQAWLEASGLEALRLPGASTWRLFSEADLPDYRPPETGVATWLTCLDVVVPDLDRAFEAIIAAERDGVWARRMLGLATRREVRAYRPIEINPVAQADEADHVGEVLHAVWWTPDDGAEQALADWYDADHIPRLMTVPGWLRIRRFELVNGDGPRFLALHDIASAEVPQSGHPALVAAGRTRWRERVLRQRRQYEFGRFVAVAAARTELDGSENGSDGTLTV